MADWERKVQKLLSFDNLEKPVRLHLKNVYSTLCIAMLSAAMGAYVHLFTSILKGGILTFVGSIVMLLLLIGTAHSRENQLKRFGYMLAFAFFTGMGLGPLMESIIMIDPSIIPTAFMATTLIFGSFSISSLFSEQRKWLFLGGTLFSALSWMMLLSFLNIFLGSQLIFEVNLYLGLAVMCAFVLYDTQLIVEKRRLGDDDYIWHCVDLFLDFVSIFRHLMVILGNKENKKKRSD